MKCQHTGMQRIALVKITLPLVTVLMVGCGHGRVRYRNVKLMTSESWPLGLAKTCFLTAGSEDNMTMHCRASGDPDTNDGTVYVVTAVFDKPVHSPSGSVFGVVCRLDSVEHATCNEFTF